MSSSAFYDDDMLSMKRVFSEGMIMFIGVVFEFTGVVCNSNARKGVKAFMVQKGKTEWKGSQHRELENFMQAGRFSVARVMNFSAMALLDLLARI